MRCSKTHKLISEYIDGDLNSRQRLLLEKHLESCLNCREFKADFLKITGTARDLGQPTPSDKTWDKIQSRLQKDGPVGLAPILQPGKRFALSGFQYALASAVVLMVVVGAITLGPRFFKSGKVLSESDKQMYTLAKLDEAEAHYQKAIKALAEAVAVQDTQLDPEVAAVFQVNLEIINASISACKQAVLSDPDSLDSRNYLLAAYEVKANLLNKMFHLTDEAVRKENIEKTL